MSFTAAMRSSNIGHFGALTRKMNVLAGDEYRGGDGDVKKLLTEVKIVKM